MSRGAGKIERLIKDLFDADPGRIESTADLCRAVFGIEIIEKKHRVAVLRALKSVASKTMPSLTRHVALYERNDDFWFDARVHPLRGRNVAPATAARPPKR
jgi:predicted transcriptional regulator